MEALIKSMCPITCDELDEAFGKEWRVERKEFYEDGVRMYDVLVNLNYVSIEVSDYIWIHRIDDDNYKVLTAVDYFEIVVR